ncbi:MAG TPA: PAS domain S-box protein [Anaeromyxobacter sp.]|nr:PAS domain S-box protein [Anaeromyxobacter sp.]
MAVWAGPELVLLYNDAYLPLLGSSKHPWAMGRTAGEVLEQDDAFGAELRMVREHGRSVRHPRGRGEVERSGPSEEARFTYTLTPIREGDGRVVGVLHLVEEAIDPPGACEEGYRALFRSIDEGMNVIELVYDESGHAIDYTILEANPAQERMTGRRNLTGKRASEVVPDLEDRWLAVFEEVARTGVAARFEAGSRPLERWFTVKASRVGGAGSRTLALVFHDVTQRKRREASQALLDAIAGDFAHLSTEEEITQAIGARLATHLDASTCSVADFAEGMAMVRSAFARPGAVTATVPLKVSDYLNEELQALARAGRTVVVRDTRADPRLDADRYEAMGVRAGIIVPFQKGGEWRHSLAVGASEPRDWREDQVRLLEEVAGRYFPRIERARAEEALRATLARARTISQNIRDYLVILRAVRGDSGEIVDWRYEDANEGALQLLGLGREDLIGTLLGALFPEQRDLPRRLERVLAEGRPVKYESTFRDMALWVTLFRIDEETVGSASVDITDRKQAEAYAQSLARFPEENPDPVLRLSGDLLVEYVNSAGLRAFGALGVERGLLVPTPIAGPARIALRERGPVKAEVVCQGAVYSVTVVAVGAEVNVYAQDITERKRAGEALRLSEARLRRLWDSGMIGIFYFDLDGSVTDANDKFLGTIGYTRDDLGSGRILWEQLTPPEYRSRDERAIEELRAAGVDTPYEKEFIRKDGSRVSVFLGAAMFDDERQRGISFVLDIEERKRAEQGLRASEAALREADRRKDEFLGVLSHELRNPLAPIRNSLFILDRAAAGSPQARRAKEVVERQVLHLSRLVDDLLDMTRIARGKVKLDRSELDLVGLVRRTVEDNLGLLSQRGLEIEVRVPRGRVRVIGDETRLVQVLGNLLQNAAKFTPPGGRVTVAMSVAGRVAELHVRDTGAGIERALLGTIFEPFTQGEQTLARSDGGLGLGLSLVKGLVELHGGEVRALSEGPGHGTDLVVTLPLARSPSSARGRRRRRSRGQAVRRRVLIVDDNEDAADSLAQLVEFLGHEAEVAHEGRTALAKARANPPDVILCDIGLPGMDGYAVAREVRRGGPEGVRLVAVSGYARPEDIERATEAGFEGHVAKPPDPDRIKHLLQ